MRGNMGLDGADSIVERNKEIERRPRKRKQVGCGVGDPASLARTMGGAQVKTSRVIPLRRVIRLPPVSLITPLLPGVNMAVLCVISEYGWQGLGGLDKANHSFEGVRVREEVRDRLWSPWPAL